MPESEIGVLREKLKKVEETMRSLQERLLDGEWQPSREGEDAFSTNDYSDVAPHDGRVEPLLDLTAREKKIDYGGRHEGRYEASDDILADDDDDN